MALRDGVAATKDVFTLVKDMFVGVLVGALLLSPARLNQRLKDAGFTQGNFGVLTWQAAQTAQNVSEAKQDVQDVTGGLGNLAADPKYAKDPRLQPLLDKLKNSEVSITSADSALKTTVAQQQQQQQGSAQQPTAQPAPVQGWIMLGRIEGSNGSDAAPLHWVSANINVPAGSPYALAPGQEVDLTDTVYLRAESLPGKRAAGTILSVLPTGRKVKLLQVDTQSHALAGGWFVWAQVTVDKNL